MADIRELISVCETSEIFIQNLDENVTEMQVYGKNGRMKFITNPNFVLERMRNNPTKIGFVVWLPKDVFERLEKFNQGKKDFEQQNYE